MKKTTLFLFAICFFALANLTAQTEFITTWKTDNSGSSSSTSITIPTNTTEYTYSYDVDWDNNGIIDEVGITGDITHDYGTAGTYTIAITGTFPQIYFNNSDDKDKILSIEQWGTQQWASMGRSFYGCTNLVDNSSDTANTTSVTNMSYAFSDATNFNRDINNWDVSNVTDMSYMFNNAEAYNKPLWNWSSKVGNVANMSYMFSNASLFNQYIKAWNVSSVIDMSGMFSFAQKFNQDISDWDISNVTNMNSMFADATDFNQNVGGWDISNVSDMGDMFINAALSIDNYDNTLIGWNTLDSGETQIPTGIIFHGGSSIYCSSETAWTNLTNTYNWSVTDGGICTPFITTWDTTNTGSGTSANNQLKIYANGGSHNYNVDWGDGTTSTGILFSVTHTYDTPGIYTVSISGTFPKLDYQDDDIKLTSINQWGNQKWTSLKFGGCTNLINYTATDSPDLSNVTDLSYMFYDATNFNGNINSWDVSTIVDMTSMFEYATAFNQPLNNWDVSNVVDMSYMFSETTVFNQPLNNWDVGFVEDMSYMFSGTTAFNQPLNNWDVAFVENMQGMFYNATLFNQDISNWNVSGTYVMGATFGEGLEGEGMFENATAFNQNLGSWDISNVFTIINMFNDAGLSSANYDNILIGWNTLDAGETQIPTDLIFVGTNSTFCLGETARNNLINTYDWFIEDGGLNCSTLSAEDFNTETLSFYPNPVKSSFTIKGLNAAVSSLEIVNIQGQLVKEVANYNAQPIAIDTLANGMYFVNVSTPNGIQTIKIIKE